LLHCESTYVQAGACTPLLADAAVCAVVVLASRRQLKPVAQRHLKGATSSWQRWHHRRHTVCCPAQSSAQEAPSFSPWVPLSGMGQYLMWNSAQFLASWLLSDRVLHLNDWHTFEGYT